MTRARPRRLPPLALVLAGLCVLAVLAAPGLVRPAQAFISNPANGPYAAGEPDVGRCAAMTGNDFTGTVLGADGLGVNVTIGFDLKNAAGDSISLASGCPVAAGYGAIVQLNHDITGQGAPLGTPMTTAAGAPDGVVGEDFALTDLPANAATVWVEAYARTSSGSRCGWACAGPVDTSKYGFLNRRAVPVVDHHLDLRLPLTPAHGGTTGQLDVRLAQAAGEGVTVQHVYAWSMLTPDGSRPDQGWGIGVLQPDGSYLVPALGTSGHQTYVVWAYTSKGLFKLLQIPVTADHTTTQTLDLDGPRSVDLTKLPAHRLVLTRQGRQAFTMHSSTAGTRAAFTGAVRRQVRAGTPVRLVSHVHGHWTLLAATTVTRRHGFRVAARLPYRGSATWRVVVGNARDTVHVVAH